MSSYTRSTRKQSLISEYAIKVNDTAHRHAQNTHERTHEHSNTSCHPPTHTHTLHLPTYAHQHTHTHTNNTNNNNNKHTHWPQRVPCIHIASHTVL